MRKVSARASVVAVAAAALGATALYVAPASAADAPPGAIASLTGSEFEIDSDANLTKDYDDYTFDWDNVTEVRGQDEPTGQGDDSYKGGTKEDTECPDETTGSIPNNKSDLLYFAAYRESGDPGFLNLYWLRVAEPSGTTLMDFEFNQSTTPCATGPNVQRTDGDLLIEYLIDQGGARAEVTLRRWDGTAGEWGPVVNLGGDAVGTINETPIDAADSDGLLPTGATTEARTFGEAQIDLDAIFDPEKCESFGSAMLKSRSSDSFTSQLKDFIAPQPVNITNCGKVIVRKQTDPDGASETFGYTKSFGTDPATSDTFTLADDGVQTFDNVLFGSGYTVTEDSVPGGWDFDSIDCSASTNVTPSVSGATATFDIDSAEDIVDCTYYNSQQTGSILVEKVVAGTTDRIDGATFALDEDGDPETTGDQTAIEPVAGETGLFCVDGLVFDTYYVVETAAPSGYTGEAGAKSFEVSTPSTCAERTGDTPDLTFVNTAQTSLSTTPELLPNDSATLSGGYGTLSGTISFELYDNADCSGTAVYEEDVAVTGAGTYATSNTTYTIGDDGTYSWKVTYASGDASNEDSMSSCDAEQQVIDFTPLAE